MRWILSITPAICLITVFAHAGGAQAADKFTPACTLPFDAISVHRPIGTSCEIERRPRPEDGALEANKEQNRAKNNFCAVGSPVTVTKKAFKDLETKSEAHRRTDPNDPRSELAGASKKVANLICFKKPQPGRRRHHMPMCFVSKYAGSSSKPIG